MGLDVLGEVVAAHEPLVADGAGEPATPLLLGELHSMWNRHRSLIHSIQTFTLVGGGGGVDNGYNGGEDIDE